MNNKIKCGDYVIYKHSPRSFMAAQVLTIDIRKTGFIRVSVKDEITIDNSDEKAPTLHSFGCYGLTKPMDYKETNDWYPSENVLNNIKRITKKDFNALLQSYKTYMDTISKADETFNAVYNS